MEKYNPAIIIIAYNRPESLKRVLNSVKNASYPNTNITLVISIDFWKSDNPCYSIADDFLWEYGEKNVIKHQCNLGLKCHVLACGDLSENYGAVILLEDDVVVAPYFYYYAQEACYFYQDRNEVLGIGLFCHAYMGFAKLPFYPVKNGLDTYYGKWVISWGECFMKKQWKAFRQWYNAKEYQLEYKDSFPNKITDWSDSAWSKYMYYYMDETDKYFVSPYEAYATNWGDMGEHYRKSTAAWQTSMQYGKRAFLFAKQENAVRYNFFFENMDEKKFKDALGLSNVTLLVDLYGQCKGIDNYDYCLSTRVLNYEVVKTFALEMRPIEMNVFQNIMGDGIYLYDVKKSVKISKKARLEQIYRIYKYYYPFLQYYKTLTFVLCETKNKIREKIKNGLQK